MRSPPATALLPSRSLTVDEPGSGTLPGDGGRKTDTESFAGVSSASVGTTSVGYNFASVPTGAAQVASSVGSLDLATGLLKAQSSMERTGTSDARGVNGVTQTSLQFLDTFSFSSGSSSGATFEVSLDIDGDLEASDAGGVAAFARATFQLSLYRCPTLDACVTASDGATAFSLTGTQQELFRSTDSVEARNELLSFDRSLQTGAIALEEGVSYAVAVLLGTLGGGTGIWDADVSNTAALDITLSNPSVSFVSESGVLLTQQPEQPPSGMPLPGTLPMLLGGLYLLGRYATRRRPR